MASIRVVPGSGENLGSGAVGRAWVPPPATGPDLAAPIETYPDVKFFYGDSTAETGALIRDNISSLGYGTSYTCLAGLNVGDPVRLDGDDNVVKANATTEIDAAVIGICGFKVTSTTCFVVHFYHLTGTGFTAGDPIYLSDIGTFATTGGTVEVVVGIAINSTEAKICIEPTKRFGGGGGGGLTADDKEKFITVPTFGLVSATDLPSDHWGVCQITNTPIDSGWVQVLHEGIQCNLGTSLRNKEAYFASLPPFLTVFGGSGLHSNALRSDGSAWTFGDNSFGQHGTNNTTSRSSPVSVIGNHTFARLANGCGTDDVNALKVDGSGWSWGRNNTGQCGDGTTTSRSSPVSVIGGHVFDYIVTGVKSTHGLKSDGTAWGWGANTTGSIGDNSITNRSSPVSIVGNHSWVQVSGGSVSLFLKADGSAWASGPTTLGNLGDNTNVDRSSPVSVVGAHSFRKLSAGTNASAGLKSDGTVWTWGKGTTGSVGEGSVATTRSSPVSVIGGHSFIDLCSGNENHRGLKADGSVWCWGIGTNGQNGDNSSTTRSSPVLVVGGHSFIRFGGGYNTMHAIKSDGSIWSWGQNSSGELGDGTQTNRSSPVLVVGGWGNSARDIAGISAGDWLIWMPRTAGEVASTDQFDLNYVV